MPLAHAEIDAALEAGRRPIVVGGTGLYLRAALAELSLVKAPPESEDSELWSPRDASPDARSSASTWTAPRSTGGSTLATEAIVASGARRGGARVPSARAVAHRPQGPRLRRAARGRPRARCSSAPATTPAASSPGCEDPQPRRDRPRRPRPTTEVGAGIIAGGRIGCAGCDSRSGRRWATTT